MSNKIAKWRKWLDVAYGDCANLMLSRDMFLDLHKMIEKNPRMQVSDYFHDYMRDTYISHVTIMLRKHTKISAQSISLQALAIELQEVGAENGLTLTKSFGDLVLTFRDASEKVEAFTDRVVAHRDRRKPSSRPTYNDVHKAIAAMDDLTIACSNALSIDYGDTCKPTVQYGWLQTFREMGIET